MSDFDAMPAPWEMCDPDEAYELWLAWVDAGADPNELDWRGYV